MKKLILAVAMGFVTVGAVAQGYFTFGNRISGSVDAPVLGPNGAKLDGAAWAAQAYVGATADSLVPVGSVLPFRTAAAAGYITSTKTVVPTMGAGNAVVEMRVWEVAKGATYEASLAAGGIYGKSNPVTVALVVEPNLPNNMVGLVSFTAVPEPSIMALGVLGVAALMLRRRS